MSLNRELQQRFERVQRERRIDRALEVDRAKEASRYARRARPVASWQRVSPELAVLLMLALAALAAGIAWAGRAWGF